MHKTIVSTIVGAALLFTVSSPTLACMDYDYSNQTLYFNDNGEISPAQIIVEYVANIVPRDLKNSRGVRLTNFAAMLQQDRANLHKSGYSDDPDGVMEVDNYFTNAERRSLLSSADYFFYCDFEQKYIAELKQQIVSAQVPGWVSVTVFKHLKRTIAVFIQLVG